MKLKTLILTLILLGGFGLRLSAVGPDMFYAVGSGTQATTSGSDTYLLARALTGTVSAAVDMTTIGGILVKSTGTAQMIYPEWNSVTYTSVAAWPWSQGTPVQVGVDQFISKQAKYLRFRVSPASYAGTVATVWYSTSAVPGSTAPSGSATSANQVLEIASLTTSAGALTGTSGVLLGTLLAQLTTTAAILAGPSSCSTVAGVATTGTAIASFTLTGSNKNSFTLGNIGPLGVSICVGVNSVPPTLASGKYICINDTYVRSGALNSLATNAAFLFYSNLNLLSPTADVCQ